MRLIDADALKQADFQDFSNTDVMCAIDEAPTVEIVKRGAWVEKYDHWSQDYYADKTYYACNLCEKGRLKYKGNYCPHCGADMRGEPPCLE